MIDDRTEQPYLSAEDFLGGGQMVAQSKAAELTVDQIEDSSPVAPMTSAPVTSVAVPSTKPLRKKTGLVRVLVIGLLLSALALAWWAKQASSTAEARPTSISAHDITVVQKTEGISHPIVRQLMAHQGLSKNQAVLKTRQIVEQAGLLDIGVLHAGAQVILYDDQTIEVMEMESYARAAEMTASVREMVEWSWGIHRSVLALAE